MFNKITSFLREAYKELWLSENNHVEDVVVTITYSDGTQKELAATRSGLFELENGKVPQPIPFDGYR